MKSFWQAVTAIMTTLIAGSCIWIASQIVDLRAEIIRFQEFRNRVEQFMAGGPMYTRKDIERDLGPIVEKVNDHELRIRTVEGRGL